MISEKRKNRLVYFDYIRALAIGMVIFIHSGFSWLNNIALFLMPVFFFQAGYLYNPAKAAKWRTVKKDFRKLMIPFYICIVIYAVLEIFRSQYFGYINTLDAWKPALLQGVYGSGILPNVGGILDGFSSIMNYKGGAAEYSLDIILPTTCHLWFLPAMFSGKIVFIHIVDKTQKSISKVITIIILLFLCSIEVIFPQVLQLPLSLGRGFAAAAWMCMGYWAKEFHLFEEIKLKKDGIIFVVAGIVTAISLLLGSNASALVAAYYGAYGVLSVAITLFGGCAAVIFVTYSCMLLDKLPVGVLKKVLCVIGSNTMVIYLWHMIPKTALEMLYSLIIGGIPAFDEFYMGLMPGQAGLYIAFEGVVIVSVLSWIGYMSKKRAWGK